MAQFRRSHGRRKSGKSDSRIRIILMIGVTLLALILLWNRTSKFGKNQDAQQAKPYSRPNVEMRDYLPESSTGVVVHHQYFSLSYSEIHEQAEWVAYRLDKEMLDARRYPRTDNFQEDGRIPGGSASDDDFRGSGYTRGHLVPAADMAFDPVAMQETFYFSNISPQVAKFNGGIWRELEEQTRDWARKAGQIYIVTGPVLKLPKLAEIGRNDLAVAPLFFKVLLDPGEPESKGIAFLIPNALSDRHLSEYAVTIDSVEKLTGIDFFPGMAVEQVESAFNLNQWEIREDRYRRRVESWNRR